MSFIANTQEAYDCLNFKLGDIVTITGERPKTGEIVAIQPDPVTQKPMKYLINTGILITWRDPGDLIRVGGICRAQ